MLSKADTVYVFTELALCSHGVVETSKSRFYMMFAKGTEKCVPLTHISTIWSQTATSAHLDTMFATERNHCSQQVPDNNNHAVVVCPIHTAFCIILLALFAG